MVFVYLFRSFKINPPSGQKPENVNENKQSGQCRFPNRKSRKFPANNALRNAFNQGKQAKLRLIKVVVRNGERNLELFQVMKFRGINPEL